MIFFENFYNSLTIKIEEKESNESFKFSFTNKSIPSIVETPPEKTQKKERKWNSGEIIRLKKKKKMSTNNVSKGEFKVISIFIVIILYTLLSEL